MSSTSDDHLWMGLFWVLSILPYSLRGVGIPGVEKAIDSFRSKYPNIQTISEYVSDKLYYFDPIPILCYNCTYSTRSISLLFLAGTSDIDVSPNHRESCSTTSKLVPTLIGGLGLHFSKTLFATICNSVGASSLAAEKEVKCPLSL